MSFDPWGATSAVQSHPRLEDRASGPEDADRLASFAWELSAWLAGAPRGELGALARVITVLLATDLAPVRAACRGLALMAVEAGARAAAALWRVLGQAPESAPEPEEPDAGEPGETEGAGQGAAGLPDASGDGEDTTEPERDAEPSEGPSEPLEAHDDEAGGEDVTDLLEQLLGVDAADDPELDGLSARLQQGGDGVLDDLEGAGDDAMEGAMAAEALQRAVERVAPGVGWGVAPGSVERALLANMTTLAELIDRLPELGELASILGRAEAAGTTTGVGDGGGEEVVGVRVGGEVALALPSELGLLGDPDTEDLFYLRFSERRLVSLELAGGGLHGAARPEKRGPVIACIDTSGSMTGGPEVMAKALVLAICRTVLPQRRAVHLLAFGATDELSEVRLSSGAAGLERLLAFLARGFRGGTDFDTPLVRAMELLEERELQRADVLVVTDGWARARREVEDRVNRVREQQGLRVWTVLMGGSHSRFTVERFSDHIWHLDPDQATSVRLVRDVTDNLGRRI